jgi:hypothetical protein
MFLSFDYLYVPAGHRGILALQEVASDLIPRRWD